MSTNTTSSPRTKYVVILGLVVSLVIFTIVTENCFVANLNGCFKETFHDSIGVANSTLKVEAPDQISYEELVIRSSENTSNQRVILLAGPHKTGNECRGKDFFD